MRVKDIFNNRSACIYSTQADNSPPKIHDVNELPLVQIKFQNNIELNIEKEWQGWKDNFSYLLCDENTPMNYLEEEPPQDILDQVIGKSGFKLTSPDSFTDDFHESCPKSLFTRYKSYDFNNRRMKSMSVRSIHTSNKMRDDNNWEQFSEQREDTTYLQPSKSTLSVVRLAKRAGFDMKVIPENQSGKFLPKKNILYHLIEREKREREQQFEPINEEKIKEEPVIKPPEEVSSPPVSLLRQLSMKQEEIRKQRLLKAREAEDLFLSQRKMHTFIQKRGLHTSLRAEKEEKSSKEEKVEYLPPICSGCTGIAKALEDYDKPRGPISCSTRGAGKCRGPRNPNPSPEATSLYRKCKFIPYGKCRQPREEICEIERDYGIGCMKKRKDTPKKKRFHTSAASHASILIADEQKDEEYCPWKPAERRKRQPFPTTEPPPQLSECPRRPGQKRKDCAKIERQKNCIPQKKSRKAYICQLAGFFGVGCGRKQRPQK